MAGAGGPQPTPSAAVAMAGGGCTLGQPEALHTIVCLSKKKICSKSEFLPNIFAYLLVLNVAFFLKFNKKKQNKKTKKPQKPTA